MRKDVRLRYCNPYSISTDGDPTIAGPAAPTPLAEKVIGCQADHGALYKLGLPTYSSRHVLWAASVHVNFSG